MDMSGKGFWEDGRMVSIINVSQPEHWQCLPDVTIWVVWSLLKVCNLKGKA